MSVLVEGTTYFANPELANSNRELHTAGSQHDTRTDTDIVSCFSRVGTAIHLEAIKIQYCQGLNESNPTIPMKQYSISLSVFDEST
jgi:hypothetical protein